MFDNGNLRLDSSLLPCGLTTAPAAIGATKFQFDEDTRQATLEWQYLPGFFSFWGGSIEVSGNSRHIESTSHNPLDTPHRSARSLMTQPIQRSCGKWISRGVGVSRKPHPEFVSLGRLATLKMSGAQSPTVSSYGTVEMEQIEGAALYVKVRRENRGV